MSPEGGPAPVRLFTGEIEAFGGAERSLLALSRWLHRNGISSELVTYFDRVGIERHASHPLRVVQLQPAGGALSKVRALRQYVANASASSFLASGYQAALHTSLAGLKGFSTLMHDTAALLGDASNRSLQGKLRIAASNRLIGRGLRSAGITIVTSEFLKQECWKDFGVRAQIVRMGGLDTIQFRPRIFAGTLNLLSVSRIEANKRIDWVLQALASLEQAAPPLSASVNWRLRVAGKGSQIEAMRSLATRLGLQNRVEMLGFVPDERLAALYDEAHLFLMPAVQGYGIPAVEALQAGIPVLVHRDSGVSDVLLDTPWATVAQGGPERMSAALQEAIRNVVSGSFQGAALPPLQTEAGWAEEVASLCGWSN